MKRGRLLGTSALFALALALGACTDSKNTNEATAVSPTPAAESAAAATTPAPAATPTPAPTPDTEPPPAADVREAVARVYKGAVKPDVRPGSAIVGDFNGDGSEDLAVRVRAESARVGELNEDLANWIVSDPRKVRRPDPRKFDPHQGVQKLDPPVGRARVEPADTLLVVLHGYKEAGWRGREASQTYLLKGAGGTDLRAQSRAEARFVTQAQNPPRIVGDVIRMTLGGERGFLYWNGATYGWFTPGGDK